MDRRDFLVQAGLAGLAATSPLIAAAQSPHPQLTPNAGPAGKGEPSAGEMLHRQLGRTGERVSAIGLGGYHIGKIKDDQESIKLIRTAIDRGLTFMDNCWDYHNGRSEELMGKALKDGYRDRVFLMTKLDGRTREAAARQIDESLRRLSTDRIDLMQIHEIIRLEDPDRCFAKDGAIDALKAAQKDGKIRYVGFTGHKDPLVHLRMLDLADQNAYRFDAVQMPLNVMDAHFRSFGRQVLPRLVFEGIGILGMKPLGDGGIVRGQFATAAECLQFALTLPTSVVITGIESLPELEQALAVARDFKPFTAEQMAALLDRTRAAALTGDHEKFKTSAQFDGTARHPEWMS